MEASFNKLHVNIRQILALKISWRFIEKCTAEKYPLLVNDMTLPSDKSITFKRNTLEKTFQNRTYNKIVLIDDQVKDEKLQYDVNTEAAKISALSSDKIDKYEYLNGEEILPSN